MSDDAAEDMTLATVRLLHSAPIAVEAFITTLPEKVEKLTDGRLWECICTVDLLQEQLSELATPRQEDWLKEIYNILVEEWDARWFLQKLQERGIIRLERRP
ncbi:MAG: hypothetical protein HXK47_05030 [Atopobium sp.]|nr:hypothetical protein [Atopobium sp.]